MVWCWLLYKQPRIKVVWGLSALALIIHFGLYFFGESLFPKSTLAFANPGLTAAIALLLTNLPIPLFHSNK